MTANLRIAAGDLSVRASLFFVDPSGVPFVLLEGQMP